VIVAAAAASGAMALTMPVQADSTADGVTAGSPGAVSGNTIQLPVHVPVNVCGNTVNVVGLLNPAAGNTCANAGGGAKGHAGEGHGNTSGGGGAVAEGVAEGSPGVISGNGIQLPVDVPVNVSGNSVNVVGVGNPVIGNVSVNDSGKGPGKGPEKPEEPEEPGPEPEPRPETPGTPPTYEEPGLPSKPSPSAPERPATRAVHPQGGALAHTGADHTAPAIAGAAVLLVGGATLYRRFRQVAPDK
jgi:LPXTG-motif cell wall-anchored protein